jgi:hypothetical protein
MFFGLDRTMFLSTICNGTPDCICASACALIWFGAVIREGRVGLHRPRFTDPAFSALPPDVASGTYRKALQDISQYLEEMEAPRPLIDAMVATASSEIHWVDDVDATKSPMDRRLRHPPSWREWVDASCGAFTTEEEAIVLEWPAQAFSGIKKLTPHEDMLARLLSEKHAKRSDCERKLMLTRRDALPAP